MDSPSRIAPLELPAVSQSNLFSTMNGKRRSCSFVCLRLLLFLFGYSASCVPYVELSPEMRFHVFVCLFLSPGILAFTKCCP